MELDDKKPKVEYQTPVGNLSRKRPRNIVDSEVNSPTAITGATSHSHHSGMAHSANAVFGTPSAITHPTPFNRAVSVPGGQQRLSSPSNQATWPAQDVTNVRGELLKALPFYKNIHAAIESQPEVQSRLDVLHYLGINIHHPHMARPGGLGSLLAVWNLLAGCSSQHIRELKNENSILKIESTNLKNENTNLNKRVADLEANVAQSQTEVVGDQVNERVKEPTRFDGSEPNKYVRYINFMLWKRAIARVWVDRPDDFKTEKDKICYVLFCLDGDAFWDVADAAEAIVNSKQDSEAWKFKTGDELIDRLTEKYGKCE